jgi:leader peptidase (prepilin peptidase) / N-methyltransferase
MIDIFWIYYVFVFIFGLCIGSFLNCIIYRLEQEKQITGRSFCPQCKHQISWKDLFPVFSFLFLKGKCRYCQKKISIQYPLLELSLGILFIAIFYLSFTTFRLLPVLHMVYLFYIFSSLAAIFMYDFKHFIIPDKILFPAIIISLVYDVIVFRSFFDIIWAIAIGAGFFLMIFLFSNGRAMGFGDVKLAVLMGLFLSFQQILVALFLAFFLGAIIGIILMLFQKKGFKSEIPFGPFLIMGTFIAMFWGDQIIQWYLYLAIK